MDTPGAAPAAAVSRPWRAAAVGVAATCWLLVGGAVVLQVVHGVLPGLLAYWLMDVVTATVYGGVTLLLLPRSRHPVAWIVAATGLGCGLSGFVTQLTLLEAAHPGVPLPDVVRLLPAWVWMPGTYASMAVLPWLVAPHRLPRWVRLVASVATVLVVALTLSSAVALRPGVDNPLALPWDGLHRLVADAGVWPQRLVVAVSLAGVARLAWLRWRVGGEDCRGYGWLVVGQLFLAVAFVPLVLPWSAGRGQLAADFAGVSLIAAQAFLPGALLVVVLGHRLWGIEATVDRGAVWLMLTGAVVGGYVLLVWFAQLALPRDHDLAEVLAVAVVLAASQPLRHWIERRVDRLVHGPAHDPTHLLRVLGEAPVDAPGSARSLDSIVAALAEGLRLGGVEVRAADGRVVARAGRPGPPDLRLPLVVEGRRPGELLVSATGGQSLDARTRRMIEQMDGVIAVVLELALANERLAAASDRLLEVRHEERRILRRDLHDGMGPALAGVGLGLEAARRRLVHDPAAADELLGELQAELARRTDDVRLLARSVLPAQLDDGDLPAALAVLAARLDASSLVVQVDTTQAGTLETGQQIAVYHVAAEALMNAHRHAGAGRVDVRVRGGEADPVVLEVVDDGVGLQAAPLRGVGLQSMRERADELGGRLELCSGPAGRGTCVRMVLP